MKIGIPTALLYYWFGNVWEDFWRDSGQEVITSPITDHRMVQAGSAVAVDELCLPIKIFLGHVQFLLPRVDLVMIPHLIKIEPEAYICPKFMGLPDLVSQAIPESRDRLLSVKVGPTRTDMFKSLQYSAVKLGIKKTLIAKANFDLNMGRPQILPSLERQLSFNSPKKQLCLKLGLLGHPYALYDSFFNLDLLKRLTDDNISFVTPEMTPREFKGVGAAKLDKKIFWTMGRSQFDALEWMLNSSAVKVDGYIQIAPFACGLEAIIGDLLERRIKTARQPLLKLNFEEHSGEAGMVTRIEAFLDLIRYRKLAC